MSTALHSMVVERAVSHYNIFRNYKRLSMSLQSVNDRLLDPLNGVGTGNFDPRPAVAHNHIILHRHHVRQLLLLLFSLVL